MRVIGFGPNPEAGRFFKALAGERRKNQRFRLLTRVDVLSGDGQQVYWGSLTNISRTGLALSLRQPIKPRQKILVRFHFRGEDCQERSETLAAKVIWKSGDHTGLEFDIPLTTTSPALRSAPCLSAHLAMKEAGG